jgi:hypothetical protein
MTRLEEREYDVRSGAYNKAREEGASHEQAQKEAERALARERMNSCHECDGCRA